MHLTGTPSQDTHLDDCLNSEYEGERVVCSLDTPVRITVRRLHVVEEMRGEVGNEGRLMAVYLVKGIYIEYLHMSAR